VIAGVGPTSPYVTTPALLDETSSRTPSCSLAEAVASQDLFVNQFIATAALNLLWRHIRFDEPITKKIFINLRSGLMATSITETTP
jgi:hypothetical protein